MKNFLNNPSELHIPSRSAHENSCFFLNHPENTSVQFSTNDPGEAVMPRKCALLLPHSTHFAIAPATPSLTVGTKTTPPSFKAKFPLHSSEVSSGFQRCFPSLILKCLFHPSSCSSTFSLQYCTALLSHPTPVQKPA